MMRPMTMNGWGYVEGDPVSRTDPSGLISLGESIRAEAIANDLARNYDVMVKDWGLKVSTSSTQVLTTNPLMPVVSIPTIQCTWEPGGWRNINELELVYEAIKFMSDPSRLGGINKFKSAMGTVRITRLPIARGVIGFAPPFPPLAAIGDVVLTDAFFNTSDPLYKKFVVIHEFGHVWDWRSGSQLSGGIGLVSGTCVPIYPGSMTCTHDATKTKEEFPGQNLRISTRNLGDLPYAAANWWEEWAESFANYIYPNYFTSEGLSPILPIRSQYVADKIKSIP